MNKKQSDMERRWGSIGLKIISFFCLIGWLLVIPEFMHYLAYKLMLKERGFELPWDFQRYCMTAHYHSDRMGEELLEVFPHFIIAFLVGNLYSEKKQKMVDLLKTVALN